MPSERKAVVHLVFHDHAQVERNAFSDGGGRIPKPNLFQVHSHYWPSGQLLQGGSKCVFHVGCADVFY